MIIGRSQPELGGRDRYFDIVGVTFYHDNQWEVPAPWREGALAKENVSMGRLIPAKVSHCSVAQWLTL